MSKGKTDQTKEKKEINSRPGKTRQVKPQKTATVTRNSGENNGYLDKKTNEKDNLDHLAEYLGFKKPEDK